MAGQPEIIATAEIGEGFASEINAGAMSLLKRLRFNHRRRISGRSRRGQAELAPQREPAGRGVEELNRGKTPVLRIKSNGFPYPPLNASAKADQAVPQFADDIRLAYFVV